MGTKKQPLEFKPIRVLIVDDFSIVRLGLITGLSVYDNIEIAGDVESAEEALDYITKNRADVVLMDLGLFGMSGIQATTLIKAINPAVKVIALTSRQDKRSVLGMMQSGADGYCMKNLPPDRLIQVIEDVYQGSIWLAPEISSMTSKFFFHSQQATLSESELTPRETEVLTLLVDGLSNNEIAKQLMVSTPTIKSALTSIFIKLNVDDRVQAAVKAVKECLV
ncbi:MAG: response regulator transcription factor [Cyanobacteria bacterium P01_H01_bin.74]